ncbi:MAG: hypothetical protein LKF31_08695 [Muribaculaceae bacterium]|jgi:hypothetical protein|nr:hypothetical protein [Muribaculaceae bacterium]
MKKISLMALALLFAVCIAGCKTHKPEMVGGTKDAHGCLGAAGYTWSVVLNSCIRTFEDGVKVEDAKCNPTLASRAVFSTDSAKVEMFLPYQDAQPILLHDGKKWTDGTLTLEKVGEKWVLKR